MILCVMLWLFLFWKFGCFWMNDECLIPLLPQLPFLHPGTFPSPSYSSSFSNTPSPINFPSTLLLPPPLPQESPWERAGEAIGYCGSTGDGRQ
jgi:hypothetical protein